MKVHGIDSSLLPSSGHLLDLSNFLVEKYGENFAEHGRLYSLIKLNKLDHPDLLKGDMEAALAKSLELGQVRNSCFRKADRIADLLRLEFTNKIKLRRPARMVLVASITAAAALVSTFVWWFVKEVAGGFVQGFFQGIFKRP